MTATSARQRAGAVVLLSFVAAGAWMLSGVDGLLRWQTRYDEARVLECLGLILVLTIGLSRPGFLLKPITQGSRWISGACVASLALGLLSASQASLPGYALIEIALAVAIVLASCCIRGVNQEFAGKLASTSLLLLAAGALTLGLRLLAETLAAIATQDAAQLEYSWIAFINPRYFAKAATWMLPLLWVAPSLTANPRRWVRWIAAIAATMIWSQLLGSGSRGALLGMAISILVSALLLGRAGRSYSLFQIGTAAAGMLLWSFFVQAYGIAAPERIASTSLSGREDLYQAAIADIRQSPLLGVGPMHYAHIAQHPDTRVAGPHDLPLQLAAEWGLPAAAMLLVLIGFFLWRLFIACRLTADNAEQRVRVAIFSAIAVAAFHGLFANVANEPISQTLLVLLAGFFPYPERPNVSVSAVSTKSRPGTFIMMAAVVIATAAGLLLALSLGKDCVGVQDRNRYTAGIGGSIYPRLWSQGLIPLEQTCRP